MSAATDIALDQRLDLLRWWKSDDGAWAIKHLQDVEGLSDNHGITQSRYIDLLSDCDTIYVDPDTTKLLWHAASTFTAQPFVPTDLFSKRGFAFFAEPTRVTDLEWDLVALHWEEATLVGEPGSIIAEGNKKLGVILDLYCDKPAYRAKGHVVEPSVWHELMPIHTSFLIYEFDYENWYQTPQDNLLVIRFFQTFLAMAGQRVVQQTEAIPSRATRKRADRAKAPGKLVIMHLPRRASSSNGDGGEAHYSHSFMVRGHWRNQWYPSIKMHRQKWIRPCVKGEGEFIAKERVGDLKIS